ncbi:MAG: tetratricopeptide repeat protein [Bdellovibrionia bacterium]
MKKFGLLMLIFLLNFTAEANTKKKDAKSQRGLVPELKLSNNESENDKKALLSEVVITRAENKAIESLNALIKKKKGTPEEADLWYRLAELYMKRSKSGRFFDLHKNTKLMQYSPFPVPNESGAASLRQAASVYFKIEKEFPKFANMDSVLFNNAFAHQQLGLRAVSESLFRKLQSNHPNSPMIPDALVALGELLYEQQKFGPALTEFLKIEKFPNSRVYSYGMYKAAWSFYNNRQTEEGVQKLLVVIKNNPPLQAGQAPNNKHHLRREALRDLAIFVSESYPATDLYRFFSKVTNGEELQDSMKDVAQIYLSHSRHKDLIVLLEDYLENFDDTPMVLEAHLYLVEAHEALKSRDKVIAYLEKASKLCSYTSSYAKSLSQEDYDSVCMDKFRKQSLDIAGRWWEIWLKNKNHEQFSQLTEKAFTLILANEDSKAPDFKTRFALAELNFQRQQYSEAAKNYQLASEQSTDQEITHNSIYGALFSLQKEFETGKLKEGAATLNKTAQLDLTKKYLTKFPGGQHQEEVRFQQALLTYKLGQIEEAQKLTLDILKSSQKKKANLENAQDLWLEILNVKKDYVTLKKDAEKYLKGATPERVSELQKISQQAHLAYIDTLADKGQKVLAAEELKKFSQENNSSPLAKDAQWKALAIFYAEGEKLEGARLAEDYAKKNPTEKKAIEGLKEAAYVYANYGQIKKAADILIALSEKIPAEQRTYLKQAADFYLLEKDYSAARGIYQRLLDKSDRKQQAEIYTKIYELSKANGINSDIKTVEEQILSRGLEPLSTEIMISRAEQFYQNRNYRAAFDLSLKANGRDVSALVRAPARLLQAKILEDELMQQSVKARLDRLALVLSLKTEKLDKAHTAYLGAAKMTDNEVVKIKALEGIDRIYSHYIASLENLPMPAGLSLNEQETLKTELKTLLSPIKDRKLENEAQLAVIKKTKSSEEIVFANLLMNESVRPLIHYPKPDQFRPRLVEAVPALKEKTTGDLNKALNTEQIQKLAPAQRALYFSFIADSQNKTEKALWLVESQLKEDSLNAELLYQRTRLVYKLDKKIEEVAGDFDKLLYMEMSSPELKAFAGVRAFIRGDLDSAIKNFSSLSIQEVYTYSVSNLMSEAYAMKGQVDKAFSLTLEQNKGKSANFESLLQEAHLWETYRKSGMNALESYKKALKLADTTEAKEWLQAKIEYLKTTNTVSSTVSPAGSY